MMRRAFTAIEVLLTLGVIAVTAGVSVPLYRNFQIRNDLDLAVAQTVHGLARAQLLSQSGQSDGAWGFRVPEGTVFTGISYELRDATHDEVISLPQDITVSGVTEVMFERVTGKPSVTGIIIFTAGNGDTRTITVSDQGVLIPSDVAAASSDAFAGGSNASGGSNGSDASGASGGDSSTGSTGGTGGSGGSSTVSSSGGTGGTDGTDGGTTGGSTGDNGGASSSSSSSSTSSVACTDRFSVDDDGTIEAAGTVDATFTVLGTGRKDDDQETSVKFSASDDDGDTWSDLFEGTDVDGGKSHVKKNITAGKKIVFKVHGSRGWLFDKTFRSNDRSGHIRVLRKGDKVPDNAFFKNRDGIPAYLKNILDSDNRISIDKYDAVLLTQLGNVDDNAKFSDAVILVHFDQESGSCARNSDPKFKITFERVENTGKGDTARAVFAGPKPVAYMEDQWIPLLGSGSRTMIDGGMTEDVQGIAVERKDGSIRVLLHGSHPGDGKEIVDARVTFSHATVTGVANDTSGNNKTEDPFNSVVNDGAGGDEVKTASDSGSVLFQTRVTAADDGIIIYWKDIVASSSASSSSAGSRTSSSSDDDQCAASYVLGNNGITLSEEADIGFKILGSYATHGKGGPKVDVRMQVSTDDGVTWKPLFGYKNVKGGEADVLRDLASGTKMRFRVEGRSGWLFNKSTTTGDGTSRIRILKNGDATPNTANFKSPGKLQTFVKSRVSQGKAVASKKELVMLTELQDLDAAADYQDVAVVVTIEKPARGGVCGIPAESSSGSSAEAGSANSGTSGSSHTSVAGSATSSSSSSSSGESDDSKRKITICHFPPGNPKNAQTISVAQSAWASHELHGDRQGACTGDEDGDGIQNGDDLCPGTYVPEGVPTSSLIFKRYALTSNEFAFRQGPRRQVSEFTLSDTRGCSCEQIIDVAENVKAYRFGQFPNLLTQIRSLFPFYTDGARKQGCGKTVLQMVQRNSR